MEIKTVKKRYKSGSKMARRNKKKIYSIILVNHGKQLRTICSDTTEVKIYKKFNEILKENRDI